MHLRKRVLFGLKSPDRNFPLVRENEGMFDNRLLTISVGIDGVPICKSSNKQFWPILGRLDQSLCDEVFLIGLYAGEEKPPVTLFLENFVNELKELEEIGVSVNGIKFDVRLSCIIADAPARSFVKCTKNHNAYFACDKCEEEGTWDGRVMLTNLAAKERTDLSFRIKSNAQHHTGDSPLLVLSFGLVTQIPLDYMHLLCLGVMRKLLNTWISGPLSQRLGNRAINQISENLLRLRVFIPREFARKTRSLRELDRFKATELRLILLYVGLVVFQKAIPKKQYEHFCLLCCATHILIGRNAAVLDWNALAEKLLVKFVEIAKEVYGSKFIIYNVHSVIHLAKDALKFGPLDNFSAFPYESYMQKLKQMLRSKSNHIQQVARRVYEREEWVVEAAKFVSMNKRLVLNERIKSYTYNGVYISVESGNNCFVLDDNSIILVTGLKAKNLEIQLYCKKVMTLRELKMFPIKSSDIGIYRIKLDMSPEIVKCIKNIVRKCILLPLDSSLSEYICCPFGKYIQND